MTLLVGGAIRAEETPPSPAAAFVANWDELGRAILRWEGEPADPASWLLGATGLYALQAGPSRSRNPLPALQRLTPALWSDTRNLTYDQLYTMADGILNQTGDMVAWRPGVPFASLSPEQQSLACVTGMRHLSMLAATLGDSTFWEVLRETRQRSGDMENATDVLLEVLRVRAGNTIADGFGVALASPDRTDLDLRSVRHKQNWYVLDIRRNGPWSFPFDIRAVTVDGDTLWFDNVSLLGNQFRFHSPARVRSVVLDPHHDLVEIYRFNNHWPRLRGNVRIQPFYTLPSWETLSIAIKPSFWQDWKQEKHYGLKFVSGFGVNLMPIYPADYRHRLSLEFTAAGDLEQPEDWGVRADYQHPVSWSRRIFFKARVQAFEEREGAALTLIAYPGHQRYLIQGPNIRYRRLSTTFGGDRFAHDATWELTQRLQYLALGYNSLALTRSGNRLDLSYNAALGKRLDPPAASTFHVLKTRINLGGVFMHWLAGDLSLVAGEQSRRIPLPYRFTNSHAWNSSLAWLPRFRGQPLKEREVSQYLGLSFSTGYWYRWLEVKAFASTLFYGDGAGSLFSVGPSNAVGFGLEHRSFITAAMYFPLWQSDPPAGEDPWAFRVEWKLEWNL